MMITDIATSALANMEVVGRKAMGKTVSKVMTGAKKVILQMMMVHRICGRVLDRAVACHCMGMRNSATTTTIKTKVMEKGKGKIKVILKP